MIKYLLDTNILIYTIKNRPPQVREKFNQHLGQMATSTVTVGELVFGAERSAQPARNLIDIEGLFARLHILDFDLRSAQQFGQIRASLYNQGTPIGSYDMMIAGIAKSQGLILVTNNEKEFNRIPGLQIENWV